MLTIHDAVHAFFLARDLTPLTVERYEATFRQFEAYAEMQHLTQVADVDVLFLRGFTRWLRDTPRTSGAGIEKRLASTTVSVHVNIVRSFLRFLVREGWLGADVLMRWETPRKEEKVVEVFTAEQVGLLYRAARQTHSEAVRLRNIAVLSLLLETGMRVGELCGLTLDDCSERPGDHQTTVRVRRKGHKDQDLVLGRRASLDLFQYKTFGRPRLLTGGPDRHRTWQPDPDEPHLLLTQYGSPLERRDVENSFELWREKAGPEHFGRMRVSPHVCRHTFAVNFLEATNGDVYTLKLLLGHSSVTVTERYLRTVRERKGWQQNSVLDRLTSGYGLTSRRNDRDQSSGTRDTGRGRGR